MQSEGTRRVRCDAERRVRCCRSDGALRSGINTHDSSSSNRRRLLPLVCLPHAASPALVECLTVVPLPVASAAVRLRPLELKGQVMRAPHLMAACTFPPATASWVPVRLWQSRQALEGKSQPASAGLSSNHVRRNRKQTRALYMQIEANSGSATAFAREADEEMQNESRSGCLGVGNRCLNFTRRPSVMHTIHALLLKSLVLRFVFTKGVEPH